MKRHLETFIAVVALSFVSALLMTSAACPETEVFCLVKE
jgi:hypothetical protein